jgi:hypothetical protein
MNHLISKNIKTSCIQGFIKNIEHFKNALVRDVLSYLKAMNFYAFLLIEEIIAKNVRFRY